MALMQQQTARPLLSAPLLGEAIVIAGCDRQNAATVIHGVDG